MAGGERHIMHEERPRIGVTQVVGVARDDQLRSAAFANIFAVCARDAVSLPSEIGSIAEAGDGLSLAGPTQEAVVEKCRGEDIGAADGRHLCPQFSIANARSRRAQRRAAAGAKSRLATDYRVHDGVFAPNGVAGIAVPIHLCVEVILVQPLRSVGQEVRSRSRTIWQRNKILNPSHNGALLDEWNDIACKRSASGTIR